MKARKIIYVVVENGTGVFWGTLPECERWIATLKKTDRVRTLSMRIVSEKNYNRFVA